jgi:hypothetical protein
MKPKSKQPLPPSGFTFNGWGVFNWGRSLNEVHRLRRDAIKITLEKGKTWKDVKDHMAVVKVKCTVI